MHCSTDVRIQRDDEDAHWPKLFRKVEVAGHSILKKVWSVRPLVEDVASSEVAGWKKTETFAFERFPSTEHGSDGKLDIFAIRLRHWTALENLQNTAGSNNGRIIGASGILFQSIHTPEDHQRVHFLQIMIQSDTLKGDGSHCVRPLLWSEFIEGKFRNRPEFELSARPLGLLPPKSVVTVMEQFIRQQLGEDLACNCVEKLEEWHCHVSSTPGLYAKRQCPAVYLPDGAKNPHRRYLMEDRKEGNMQSEDRAWTFGAKVMHDTGEWSQQLVTFTCNNDLETSTIPPSENNAFVRKIMPDIRSGKLRDALCRKPICFSMGTSCQKQR